MKTTHTHRVRWYTLTATCVLALQLLSHPLRGQNLDFSTDGGPVDPWSAADILVSDGTAVRIPAADLGLAVSADVDSFSYGDDEIEPVALYNFSRVAFSVIANSLGNGGAVTTQRIGNGNGGDKFQTSFVRFRNRLFRISPPQVISDAPVHNLTPKPNESELDGLSLGKPGAGAFPIYLSVRPGNVTWGPGDILIVPSAGAAPQLFATAAQLGLAAGDDIDALAVGTVPIGAPRPTQLGPGVVIWVSLRNGSPTRALPDLGGADGILQVYPGGPEVVADASVLDLVPGDDLDAITGLDPGPFTGLLPYVVNVGGNKVGQLIQHNQHDFTIHGGGFDVWDEIDQFTYGYMEIVGDFDVQVRVESFSGFQWSKAGLMVRETLSEFSRRAFLRVTPTGGANDTKLGYRTGVDNVAGVNGGQHEDSTTGQNPPPYPNAYLRLVRSGSQLNAYKSLDGLNWTPIASQNTTSWGGGPLNRKLLVGLAVSANYGNGSTATAEFRGFRRNYQNPIAVGGIEDRGSGGRSIDVTFTKPVGPGALNPANYSIVVPKPTLVTGIRFTSANDAPERDPMTFILEGTTGSPFQGPWTQIASGNTGLTTARNSVGPIVPLAGAGPSIANSSSYTHYRLLFPTVRDAGAAAGTQVAEIELLNGFNSDVTSPQDRVSSGSNRSFVSEQVTTAFDNNLNTKHLTFTHTDGLFPVVNITPGSGSAGFDTVPLGNVRQVSTTTVRLEFGDEIQEGTPIMMGASGVSAADGQSTANGTGLLTISEGLELRSIHVQHNKIANLQLLQNSDAALFGYGENPSFGTSSSFPALSGNNLVEGRPGSDGQERYSTRSWGLFNPSESGDHTFAMSSDDRGELYLSSDSDPANKQRIAYEPEWNGYRRFRDPDRRGFPPENISDPVNLTAGGLRYLELIYAEGGGGDYGGAAVQGPNDPWIDNNSLPIGAGRFLPSRSAYGDLFFTLGAPQITGQPMDVSISGCGTATFSMDIDGTPPYNIQWFRNGNLLPGATEKALRISAEEATNGDNYMARVSNEFGDAWSEAATVEENPDTEPPVLESAVSYYGNAISLCFNEDLDPSAASDPTNYNLDNRGPGVGISSIQMYSGSRRSVVLNLSTPVFGSFEVEATVPDCTGNVAASSASGNVGDWDSFNIGAVGNAIPGCDGDSVTLASTGGAPWGQTHSGTFLSQQVIGDFTVTVKVDGYVPPGARVGLGVFANENPDSPLLGISRTYSGLDTGVVETPGNAYYSFGISPLAPPWLRISRTGNTFLSAYSIDGFNFTVDEEQVLNGALTSDTVQVALFAAAGGPNTSVSTTYSDIQIDQGDQPVTIADIPSQTTLEDIDKEVPLTLDGGSGPLTVTASSNNPLLTGDSVVSGDGNNRTLTINPVENQFGDALITVTVTDGVDTFSTTFQLSVIGVNDRPGVTVNTGDIYNFGDPGNRTIQNAVTGNPGAANEDQEISYEITGNSNPDMFSVPPNIGPGGELNYELGAHGSSALTFVARDDGGTANGGVDASNPKTVTITYSPPPEIGIQIMPTGVIHLGTVPPGCQVLMTTELAANPTWVVGDLDGNGIINDSDLAELGANYPSMFGDTNLDGQNTFADLDTLFVQYSCNP